MLLPVDLHEWLPPDHLVWFVLETVEVLDTSGLERLTRRRGGAGAAGYDPRMLLALLIYAYCQGVRSSRQIERMCVTDVAFRVLCAQDGPDHVTIARFRCEARDVFTDLFSQVLMIAAGAGLGRFGTVAIDGTKIAANASIDANHGKQWFDQRTTELVTEAEDTDRDEDTTAAGVVDAGQDRVPAELSDRTRRAERIRQGAQELKAELQRRARADEDRHAAAAARRQRSEQGEPVVGRIPNGPHRLPEARAHLAREIAAHQAKLDRYARLIAEGRKSMGRPPVAMEDSTRVQRAQRARQVQREMMEVMGVLGQQVQLGQQAQQVQQDQRVLQGQRVQQVQRQGLCFDYIPQKKRHECRTGHPFHHLRRRRLFGASGFPCGNLFRWLIFAEVNNAAEAFLHVATQAP
ncbi:MAG: transposase, partial [Mycobacterium sp.]